MAFEFKCVACGEIHQGMPTFGSDRPLSYYVIPAEERATRCDCGSDDCVIDENAFYIRGCIEIPVHGEDEPFIWGVWVDISKESFIKWIEYFDKEDRAHVEPFFGWLNAWLKPYPDTANLKAKVHLRNKGIRPYIELEPTDHPLAVEQREGISKERVAEIYAIMMRCTERMPENTINSV